MRPFSVLAAASSFLLPVLAFPTLVARSCNIVANVTVERGDTLGQIAADARVTLPQVLFVNSEITNPDFIQVGQVILIPDSSCVVTAPVPTPPTDVPCQGWTNYTVVPNDTLYIIARQKAGVTLGALIAANPQITDTDAINIGQLINVPPCPPPTYKMGERRG